MNHDIAHCDNTQCPHAQNCQRSTLQFAKYPPPCPQWIAYSAFAPDPETGACKDFLPFIRLEAGNKTEGENK